MDHAMDNGSRNPFILINEIEQFFYLEEWKYSEIIFIGSFTRI